MRQSKLPSLLLFVALICVSTIEAQNSAPQIAVTSAASYYPSVAPGSIASVFGSGFTDTTASATLDAHGNLPISLAGVSVYVQNVAAGIFYVSPQQINFLVPSATPPGQTAVNIVTYKGQSQTGQLAVLQSAPGIFIIGDGRGAIVNAVSGSLEPFDVYDSTLSDHQTRLAIYATGLNAESSTGTVFQAYAAAPGQPPVQLQVEYAGPQGQFFGLDQINVVLPEFLDGIGDVQIFIRTGAVQSNSVLALIRNSRGPSISSTSPASAEPQTQITISGQYFASEPDPFESSPRNVVTFQQDGQVVTTVLPQSVSNTQLLFQIPYDLQVAGGYLTGTFALCVTTDGRTACSSQPTSIQSLPQPGEALGSITLSYLAALQHYIDTLIQTGPVQTLASTTQQQFDQAIAGLEAQIQSTINGSPAIVTMYGPNGPQQVSLTNTGIASFDSLLKNSRALDSLQAAQARLDSKVVARTLETSRMVAQSILPPSSTEQDLLSDAQNYQALLSVEYGVTQTMLSTFGKTLLCGLDVVSADGASTIAGLIANIISGSRYYYEFSKIFLKQIDVLPFYVSMNPGDTLGFTVSGEFVQSGAALHAGQDIHDYFKDAVKDDLNKIFGDFSCGSFIPFFNNLDNMIDTVADTLVTTMLNGPFGGGLTQLLQELVTDQNPNIVSLSPNSIGVLPGLQRYEDLVFSTPGSSLGTIAAISATPADGVTNQFYMRTDVQGGGLLISDGGIATSTQTVTIGGGVAPTVLVTANGQSGTTGGQLQFSTKTDQVLAVTLSASQSSPGSEEFTSTIWSDAGQPIGTGQTVVAQLGIGFHKIQCVMQNSAGLSSTGELNISVTGPNPPTVHFSLNVDGSSTTGNDVTGLVATVVSGVTVGVSLEASVTSNNSIVTYTWISDGSQIGAGASLAHSFSPGQHSVTLQVVDSQGATGSASTTLSVVSSALKAAFNFAGGALSGQENSHVDFNIPPGGAIQVSMWADRSQGASTFQWSIDSQVIGQNKFETASLQIGVHTIKLVVGNALGASDLAQAFITVAGTATAPTAHFTMNAQGQTANDGGTLNLAVAPNANVTVSFTSTSTQGNASITSYVWKSNGTQICSGATCSYAFGTLSNTITLTATDSNGNTSTATRQGKKKEERE